MSARFKHITVDQVVKLYDLGDSVSMLSKKLSVSINTIVRRLHEGGITPRLETNRKYHFNMNYFDIIDTEEKAYFLGFIFADGQCNSSNNVFRLNLQIEDTYIIEKLKMCLEATHPIKIMKFKNPKWKEQSYLRICSVEWATKLSEFGIVSNKGFKLKYPYQVPETLKHHFFRGVFDGDGCVYINPKTRATSIEILAAEDIANKFQESLIKNCGFAKTQIKDQYFDNEGRKIQQVKYCGTNQVQKAFEWLYKDATIYLTRKYDKFQLLYISKNEFLELQNCPNVQ